MNKSNVSVFIFSIVFFLLAACIIIFPGESFSFALEGLKLWYNIVCPALLPFFICVEILIGLGIVSLFGSIFRPLMRPAFNVPGEGSFGLFMSISSGYPVGARIIAKLRQEDLCTCVEGQRLLNLCSTSGPLFMIGAVATGIMNNPALGLFLAVPHYLSAFTVGFLMRYYKKERISGKDAHVSNPITDMLNHRKKDGRPVGMIIGDAVKAGVNLILIIGGFIIFFSVITGLLKISGFLESLSIMASKIIPFDSITPDIISGLLIGFLEVTNGVKECASLQLLLVYKLMIISFIIGFGGLSVNAQVMSIISETDLKFNVYFAFKILQGITASVYSYILFNCFSDLQVFSPDYTAGTGIWDISTHGSWIHVLMNSLINLLFVIVLMLIHFLIKYKRGRKHQSLFN